MDIKQTELEELHINIPPEAQAFLETRKKQKPVLGKNDNNVA